MRSSHSPALLILAITVGCGDPASPRTPFDVALAKGGASTQYADFTVTDAAMSLVSDGKGEYRHGRCGVIGVWGDATTHLAPAEGKIPRSQQASCGGPRAGSVTLAVRHISDDPHVDDAAAPQGGGTFNLGNVKFGWGAAMATTINASGSTPFCGTIGLRFTPVTFPGTSSVVREEVSAGVWHMYTRPWPDNVGYCENGGAVAYWHVSFDLMVNIIGG